MESVALGTSWQMLKMHTKEMMQYSVCAWRICATCNQADESGEHTLAPAIEINEMNVDEDGRLEKEDKMHADSDETKDAKHDDGHSAQNVDDIREDFLHKDTRASQHDDVEQSRK